MHYLLIQQAIIDEVVRQAFIDGNKAIDDTKFDLDKIQPVLLGKGLTFEQLDKWVAYLAMDGYFIMRSETHHRNPAYVTLTQKGLQAEISRYFIEKYNEKRKNNFKYWIEVPSQFVVGATAIIAIFMSSKSCNKSQTPQTQIPSINIKNIVPRTISSSNHHANKSNYDSVAKKLFYLDTFYVGVDTVFVEK